MVNRQSTGKSSRPEAPQARAALDSMKYEIAKELGINFKQGYNGDLTSRQAGSVGGQMVKKMSTVRTMSFTRRSRTSLGHEVGITYVAGLKI